MLKQREELMNVLNDEHKLAEEKEYKETSSYLSRGN